MKKGFFILAALLLFGTVSRVHAADINNGARVYALHCVSCHGPKGVNVMPGAPNLARGDGMMQPDLAILNTIKAGRNAMPAYNGILKDPEILDVIAFARTLRR